MSRRRQATAAHVQELALTLDGSIDGESFRAYVEQLLVPTLEPGNIGIMDNLRSHKSAEVSKMIREAGAKLHYLPPYSPDLVPIKPAFSKIKHWMRMAQKHTADNTRRHLGSLILSIQPEECSNYFQNSGYASNNI